MELPAEAIVWTCEASSNTRSYTVASLDRTAPQFELKRYSAPGFQHPQETIVMQIQRSSLHQLVATGTSQAGIPIRVTAFAGNGVAFQVADEQGDAVGRCIRDITTN